MPYSTGLIRRIDPLGRLVVPVELRRTMNIKEGDPLEILVDGELIVLRKFGAQPNYEEMWKELKESNKLDENVINQLESKYAIR